MKNSIKLVFAFSILLPFTLGVGIFWFSHKTEDSMNRTPYKEVIEMIRTSDDAESIRRILIGELEFRRAQTKSEVSILDGMAIVMLCIGVFNLVLLSMFQDKKK